MEQRFNWLLTEGAPKMIVEFLKLYGLKETPGTADNPVIMEWAKILGMQDLYHHDSDAWCGLFMGIVAHNAGKDVPALCIRALNWCNFGTPVAEPMLSDVLVFLRPGGAHVGLYIAETENTYCVGGGNQHDTVCITELAKHRLVNARRPIYKTGQPANVRKIFVDSTGIISNNEA